MALLLSDLRLLDNSLSDHGCWNLLSIAGEWRGFDSGWLEEKILERMKRRRRVRLGFGHLLVTRSGEWRRTRERIVALREEMGSSRQDAAQ